MQPTASAYDIGISLEQIEITVIRLLGLVGTPEQHDQFYARVEAADKPAEMAQNVIVTLQGLLPALQAL